MRKKKLGLGQLTISSEVCEKPADYEKLEKQFKEVLSNFESKKLEFDDIKGYKKDTLYEMKKNGNLLELVKEWQKSLEIQVPEGEEENLEKFNQLKKKDLNQIEHFM